MFIIIVICLLYIEYPASIVCWTDSWDRKRHSVSDDLMWVPGALSVHAQSRTAFLRFSREDVGGMAGESEFNMCIERERSYSSLSAASERGVAEYTWSSVCRSRREATLEEMKAAVNLCQQCQGWGAAVCRAGKSMSSLSSVTHQLKSEFSSKAFIFAAWTNFDVIAERFIRRSHPKAAVFWKALVNKLRSIVRDVPF